MTRYEEIAGDIHRLIRQGDLAHGARVPSVRMLRQRYAASVATAVSALRKLEAEGWIEARPRSGYYVSRSIEQADNPMPVTRPIQPRELSRHDLLLRLLGGMAGKTAQNLASAAASPELQSDRYIKKHLRACLRDKVSLPNYSYPPGNAELRQALAAALQQRQCRVAASEILITNGCIEAAYIALSHLTRPGDAVVVESPTYYGLLTMMESLGLRPIEVPSYSDTGVDLDALEAAFRDWGARGAVLITSLNNPMGGSLPLDHRQRLARLLERYDAWLVEDDTMADMLLPDEQLPPVKAFDRQGRVYYCASFSKTSAPGLRIGWLVFPPGEERLVLQKFSMNLSCASLEQAAVHALLASGDHARACARLRNVAAAANHRVIRFLRDTLPEGSRVSLPRGGFVAWVQLPEGSDAFELTRRLMEEGILISPGQLYASDDRYRHCFRIRSGMPWNAALHTALKRLVAVAHQVAADGQRG